MPGFIDVRLRVRRERLGDLACDLPVYASWIGVDVIKPGEPNPPEIRSFAPRPMIKRVPWATRKSHGLSQPQAQLIKAVASGTRTVQGLNSLFNRTTNKTNRIINCLVRKGVMKKDTGTDQVELIPVINQ